LLSTLDLRPSTRAVRQAGSTENPLDIRKILSDIGIMKLQAKPKRKSIKRKPLCGGRGVRAG
jgi:hypothetical protein